MAPPEALVVLYQAMCAKLQRRIHMVIEISGNLVYFVHRQLENTEVE